MSRSQPQTTYKNAHREKKEKDCRLEYGQHKRIVK